MDDVHLSQPKDIATQITAPAGPDLEGQRHDEEDGRQHATYDGEEVPLPRWFVVDTTGLLLRPPQDTRQVHHCYSGWVDGERN